MPHDRVAFGADLSKLAEIKQLSGRKIEDGRRREGLTQSMLARRVGLGVSWIREIESGNPRTRIDDHLRCAAALDVSFSYIFIPLLFMAHDIPFAPQLLAGNLHELERRWLAFIVDHNIADMRSILGSARGGNLGGALSAPSS
jgi:transcriptional regulator with XRE-family HTH domain